MLDKSWEKAAASYADTNNDCWTNDYEAYINGASEFQQDAIDKLNTVIIKYDGYDAPFIDGILFAINTIKKLCHKSKNHVTDSVT